LHQLLRAALRTEEASVEQPELLQRVQARLREGSEGRYFADGWSRVRAPRALFLGTSVLMLLIALACVLLLSPTRIEPIVP
jgi:hypothetical protein